MKRWMGRILLCLTLGSVTTVAVALIVAARGGLHYFEAKFSRQSDPSPTDQHAEFVSELVAAEGDFLYTACRTVTSPGAKWRFHLGMPMVAGAFYFDFEFAVVGEFGWPWPALTYIRADRSMTSDEFTRHNLKWLVADLYDDDVGRTDYASAGTGRPVPDRVMPIGFTIDTLFYALIWFGVFFAPGMAKRAIRRGRGRCPMCGYDLRADLAAGCPECG